MLKTKTEYGFEVELVADSKSNDDKRISTFVLTYPRFIHAELMTHRLFTRNAMSSRAVPVNKMIDHIEKNIAMPVHWGKNQPGMQAKEEHDEEVCIDLNWILSGLHYKLPKVRAWEEAMRFAVSAARGFSDAGYHKQIVNRILEPFQFIRVVVTATEWDNWYWLRDHADAQPEIKHLAQEMLALHNESTPQYLSHDSWHTPFYGSGFWTEDKDGVDFFGVTLEDALKISSSCAAQASFRKADESIEKARNIYQRLVESEPVHASPFEHQATPVEYANIQDIAELKNEVGATHIDIHGNVWSANFMGWIQNRQLIKNNASWNYEGLNESK